MRSVLALALLIALDASAHAARVRHPEPHANFHTQATPPTPINPPELPETPARTPPCATMRHSARDG